MAYIYQITNDINDKIYIGKTVRSIQERFKEHCRDYLKREMENRPLYRAMKKYGIEHFHIELLEETDAPEERERFWIEEKGSFKHGYNATIGGDGKPYLDYELLIEAYKQLQSLESVRRLYGCDTHYLSRILKQNNIQVKSNQQVNQEKFGKSVNQYDLQGNYLKTYIGLNDAARAVSKETTNLGGAAGHISDVCKGKRKTAYGFIWKFAEEE